MNQRLRPTTLLAPLAMASAIQAGEINLRITGFTNDSGMARIILMKDQAGFHGESGAEIVALEPIRNRVAEWIATDIAPGHYALIAHHDTNGNNALDRPFFTLPLEPYGFSNGAWTSLGLPAWRMVAFEVANGAAFQTIHIRMNAFAVLGKMALIGVTALLAIFGGLARIRRHRRATQSRTSPHRPEEG